MKENDEEQIAALLRMAGPRPRVSDERAARVRAAVHEEWQRNVKRRSGVKWLAVAAAVIVAVILIIPRAKQPTNPPAIVAQVQAIRGTTTPTLTPSASIAEATWIETLTGSTLSLDWNGATLRLGEGTRVQLDARTASLERGILYFDGAHSGITIKTRFGEIRDIGTQFEVRLSESSLRVRVREGRIDLRRGGRVDIAEAATELIADGTSVTKNAIAVSGAEWKWIEDAAPPLRLEGLTLLDALARVAREKGLRVELRGVDGNARLHGNVDFTPDEALDAATAATSASYRIKDGTLIVRKR